ncbi:hypothetical protein HAX54_012609 [Datura stramonium]|uniref:Uncharacterized protein n=1 Tax=Datura stramonium TaxID=4076 RepID=A0ABS8TLW3_DATST|nr:hypothetical protein [Datura stramonium]
MTENTSSKRLTRAALAQASPMGVEKDEGLRTMKRKGVFDSSSASRKEEIGEKRRKFKDLVLNNIVLNPKELSILELPLPFVEPRSVYPMANEADHSDDDFIDNQPHILTAKKKEKISDSLSLVKNKTKQGTTASPHSTRTQPRHVVKPSVKKMPPAQPLHENPVSPKKEAIATQAVLGEKLFVSSDVPQRSNVDQNTIFRQELIRSRNM